MADLSLRLLGDASSAIGAVGNLKTVILAAAKALKDFAADSIKAWNEQVRADNQLRRAAGELTEGFRAQASAMQSVLGVSDDMVQRMQSLLLAYGQAPGDVDKTVRALLDYAAVTGDDALGATERLIKGVDLGRNAFRDTGVVFDATGKKAADLSAMTDALGRKFGGGAATAADTLEGRTRRASASFGELKEGFGKFIDGVDSKFGVLNKLIKGMEALNVFWLQEGRVESGVKLNERMMIAIEAVAKARDKLTDATVLGTKADVAAAEMQLAMAEARLAVMEAAVEKKKTEAAEALTTKGRKEAGPPDVEARASAAAVAMNARLDAAERFRQWKEDLKKEEEEKETLRVEAINSLWKTVVEEEAKGLKKAEEHEVAWAKWAGAQAAATVATAAGEIAKEADAWARAGAALGDSLANALTDAIMQLASGGELDAGAMVANALSAVADIVSMIPGVGTIASMLLRAGARISGAAISAGTRKHEGGWVEAYHSGGWPGGEDVPIVAQAGERVLSRREVSVMGGPVGVERAARGGSVSVTVQTLDGSTAREFFERQGGRAIYNALRTGRGSLVPLFGGT